MVNPWFWSKNGYFSKPFFFLQYRPKKCLVRYFTTKKLFSRLKKTKSAKKSKNWHFSKGDKPLFWSKNGLFFQLFFLGNIGKENVFDDIQERKNSFLGYKKKKFQKSKNWHFSKGVKPWFWSKNGHFPKVFFLGNIGQENDFYDILQPKNSFLGYKNKKFKESKKWHFSKGANPWF